MTRIRQGTSIFKFLLVATLFATVFITIAVYAQTSLIALVVTPRQTVHGQMDVQLKQMQMQDNIRLFLRDGREPTAEGKILLIIAEDIEGEALSYHLEAISGRAFFDGNGNLEHIALELADRDSVFDSVIAIFTPETVDANYQIWNITLESVSVYFKATGMLLGGKTV